ncbi:GntR family transcriptional regulator [Saccharopolyspora shandongensis]|uniref:GntR family transcriptional regulator n=1 Tax=Saccharopolyspora shandongensis TaxID=418495 RepID=UPI0033F20B7A
MTGTRRANTRGSTRTQVHHELRKRIITLKLAPGSPLSENELATELSVSRTPVRESLILLADEGLVQVFPQLGSFVARVDPERVAEAQFVREAIETASLHDAIDRATADQIAALRGNLDEQAAAAADIEDFFRLDEEFHHLLLQAGGHGAAWRTVVSAKVHLDRARRLGLRFTRPTADMIEQHSAIVDALESRDTQAAIGAMRTHLRTVFEDIETIRTQSPEFFASPDDRPVRRIVTDWR